MLNYITQLLTPVFIALGLVNPIPEIPEPLPVIQQKIIQEVVPEIQVIEEPVVEEEIVTETQPEPTEEQVSVAPKQTSKPVITQKETIAPIIKNTVPEPVIEPEPIVIPESEIIEEESLAPEPICGSAHNQDTSAKPKDNLCLHGEANRVYSTKSGDYKWSCELDEKSTSCSATFRIDGVCNSNLTIVSENFRDSGICISGEAKTREQDGVLTWTCEGEGTGEDSQTCSALVIESNTTSNSSAGVDGACGNLVGTCSKGNATNQNTSGNVTTWKCTGSNGGSTKSCSKTDNTPDPTNTIEGCSCMTFTLQCTGTNIYGKDCSELGL